MKKFILKITIFLFFAFTPIVILNYIVDPANIFHDEIADAVTDYLSQGKIVEFAGNMDEGYFQEKMVEKMKHKPDVVIIGSSHVMYIPLGGENTYCAGMSGSYMGDYYSIVGLLEENEKLPEKVVIGVDSWAFIESCVSGRHEYLVPYAENLKRKIQDSKRIKHSNGIWGRRVQELFSPSYFQATEQEIKSKGICYFVNRNEDTKSVVISDTAEETENSKILPNGRRVFANDNVDFMKVDSHAEDVIKSGKIYQLGTEYNAVDNENFAEFEDLIRYLQRDGIDVELYLPSWYPAVYNYFESSNKFEGVKELEERIRQLGNDLGVVVHGSYDPYKCNIKETDFHDWLHLMPEKMLENYNTVLQ